MEEKPLNMKDDETKRTLKHVFENALGNPIILDSAPTKTQVKANNIAAEGSDIYIRLGNGKLIKLTGTEVE